MYILNTRIAANTEVGIWIVALQMMAMMMIQFTPANLVVAAATNADLTLQDPGDANLQPFALGDTTIWTMTGGEAVVMAAAAIHT